MFFDKRELLLTAAPFFEIVKSEALLRVPGRKVE